MFSSAYRAHIVKLWVLSSQPLIPLMLSFELRPATEATSIKQSPLLQTELFGTYDNHPLAPQIS